MIYILYFIIFSLFGFYNWYFPRQSKQDSSALFLVAFAMLIFQDGFRWEIGTDWEPYYEFFSKCNEQKAIAEEFEIGYVWLNKFINWLTDGDYTVFLVTHAVILYSAIFYFVKKYSYFPLLSIFLYYSFYNSVMGMNRQFLAIVFTLFSIKYIINRDKLKFILCIIAGFLFHRSIILFLPAFFCTKQIKTRTYIIIILILAIFSLSGLINLFPIEVFYFMGDTVINKLNIYVDGAEGNSVIYSLLSIFKRLIWVIILLIFRSKFINNTEWRDRFNLCFNIYFLSTIFYLIFNGSVFQIIVSRGLIYYNIFEIIMIPYILTFFKGKLNNGLAYLLIIIYAYLMLNKGMNSYIPSVGYDIFNPYKSVLF